MEPSNATNNKRKLKFKDRQNCNKRLKTHIQKDNDLIKYIIKCTENNTKLLEDLKYIFKSNEISDFTKRLKKYISKREKIERKFNNKYLKNKNRENEEQLEFSSVNNSKEKENSSELMSSTQDKSSNSNPTSINFVFTDKGKNIKEILIIKPINEVKEIKYSYCQLDTTNRYIVKRIKKDYFVEAYNYDLDFRNFLVMNHQLFEENNNIPNEEKPEKVERGVLREKEILSNSDNRVLLEHNNHNSQYNNGYKKVNDTYNRNNVQINSGNNVENNYANLQEATVVYTNENHQNNYMNNSGNENDNVANEEDDNDIPFPFFAKNSFGLLGEDEYSNHNNAFQNYFSNNINEKYKIVYGKEIPSNLNEYDDGDKENNNIRNTVSDNNKITKNSKNMKAHKNKHSIYNNIDNNNNMLDSEIETFRAVDITNKDNTENLNEKNINVLKEIFNEENDNKRSFLSNNNKDIYSNNNLDEISNEINNPVIDKIIKFNKNNKKSNKALVSNVNKELYLDESSSISMPPSIENFDPSLELQPNHNSKKLAILNGNHPDHSTKTIENPNNINSNVQNNTYEINEIKKNDHSNLVNSNKNKNILETTESNVYQEQNQITTKSKSFQYQHIQNRKNDIIRQEYLKRASDLKAYWPTFTFTYEDPSSKDFTTSIQKKSPFSPYLQYLILLNKELSKKSEKEKDEQPNKDNLVGGYIVINKDIKGSWTNAEIMKYIKKQRVVNNELNLLIPLKCVIYDCSPYNKYIKKEKAMYYIRLYQKLDIENHTAYVDVIVENINSEDMCDYTLLFSVPVEAFEMYICKNEEEINYHKAEVHIEHPNNEYEHFKISCILGPNNIIEFIQKLRECRGLGYDTSLPNVNQLKTYDKAKETEKKNKITNSKYEMLKLRIKNGKEE